MFKNTMTELESTTSPLPVCSGGIGGGGCCQTTGCQTLRSGCGIQFSTE